MSLFSKKEKEKEVNQNVHAVKRTRTSNISEEAQIEDKMRREKIQISEALQEVGQMYYESYRDEAHFKLVPICNMIDESYKVISLCEKQKLILRGIQICPNCKTTLDLESIFCKKCGTKLDAVEDLNLAAKDDLPQKQNNPDMIRCHECGSTMPSDLTFCTNCGIKLKSV